MVDSKENDKFDLGVKGLRTCYTIYSNNAHSVFSWKWDDVHEAGVSSSAGSLVDIPICDLLADSL